MKSQTVSHAIDRVLGAANVALVAFRESRIIRDDQKQLVRRP